MRSGILRGFWYCAPCGQPTAANKGTEVSRSGRSGRRHTLRRWGGRQQDRRQHGTSVWVRVPNRASVMVLPPCRSGILAAAEVPPAFLERWPAACRSEVDVIFRKRHVCSEMPPKEIPAAGHAGTEGRWRRALLGHSRKLHALLTAAVPCNRALLGASTNATCDVGNKVELWLCRAAPKQGSGREADCNMLPPSRARGGAPPP